MKKLDVLNGLRGYAILGVIYFHLIGTFSNRPGWFSYQFGDLLIFPLTFLSNGWLGVNLFFILSGFVLFLPYVTGQRQINTWQDIIGFYKQRAKRLLPLYYFTVLISFLFIVHRTDIYSPDFLKELLILLTATFNFSKETFIPQSNYILWSLGIEIWFSILFPFLIILIKKIDMYKFALGVAVLSLGTRFIASQHPEYWLAPFMNMIKDSLPGRLDDFMVGMLLCYLYVNKVGENFFKSLAEPLLVVSLLIMFITLNYSDYIYLGRLTGISDIFINTFCQLGFGLMIISSLYLPKGFFRFLVANWPLQMAGLMCYSLYLWHGNLRMLFVYDFSPLRILYYFVFLFAICWLSYRYIEFGNKKISEIIPE